MVNFPDRPRVPAHPPAWPLPDKPLPPPAAPSPAPRAAAAPEPIRAGHRPAWPLPDKTLSPPAAGAPTPASAGPTFGPGTTRKLRATEGHLDSALARRDAEPLENALQATPVLRPLPLENTPLGAWLGRRFPLHGRKAEMKAILETLNARDPSLNARFFPSLGHAVKTASREMQPGDRLRGMAVAMDGGHAVGVDFRCHADGRISMVVVESLQAGAAGRKDFDRLAGALTGPVNKDARVEAVLVCALGAQKDNASCMGFAKDAVKAFAREDAALGELHAGARSVARAGSQGLRFHPALEGVLQLKAGLPVLFAGEELSPRLLPPRFYKNLQSGGLLASLGNGHPGFLDAPVNRKGESLPRRLERLSGSPWVEAGEDGRWRALPLSISEKMAPMAENYRRMHRKAAEFGETGRTPDGKAP